MNGLGTRLGGQLSNTTLWIRMNLLFFFGVFLEVLTAAHNDYLVMGVYVCVCVHHQDLQVKVE